MDQSTTGVEQPNVLPTPDPWVNIRARELALEEHKHQATLKLQALAVVKDGPHRLEQAKEIWEWINGS